MTFDTGDKLACSLGFKKNIGNFSTVDWHASVSITKREGESDEEFTTRGWSEAQKQLEEQVAKQDALLDVIRPVVGNPRDYD